MADRWWYVFGGLIPDASEDDDGNPDAAWSTVTFGGASTPPDEADLSSFTHDSPWGPFEVEHLATFDHDPTEAEKNALAPAGYREADDAG